MDSRLEALERGTELDLYRVLRHLELNPGEVGDEMLIAVTDFTLERLAWLHAFFSGRALDTSPFPPGGEANWMDVRGWAVMALAVLFAVDPTVGRLPLNMPDPLVETYGRWFGDLTAADFDRAPGSRKVVVETIDKLCAAANPRIAAASRAVRAQLDDGIQPRHS